MAMETFGSFPRGMTYAVPINVLRKGQIINTNPHSVPRSMKTWKKKLLWPLVIVALALAASQPALASDDDDDDSVVPAVPDGGGTTAILLAGACLGVEALRRKFKRL
jgi:hypothetical protein